MDRTPLLELASQVGGPLAALRAEPAGLFYLPVIWRVRQYKTNSVARNPSDCYACRRDRATCPAKTVAQLRYTRSNVPITGLTDKLTRMGQIEGLFNRLPVTGGKLFRNTMRPWHRRIFRS